MYLLYNKVQNEVNLIWILNPVTVTISMKIIKVQQYKIAELLLFILSYSS